MLQLVQRGYVKTRRDLRSDCCSHIKMVEIFPLNKNHMQESHGQRWPWRLDKIHPSPLKQELAEGWGILWTGPTSKSTHLGRALLWSFDAGMSKTTARLSHASLSDTSTRQKSHLHWRPGWVLPLPSADPQHQQPRWGTVWFLHSHSWLSTDAIFLQPNWKIVVNSSSLQSG